MEKVLHSASLVVSCVIKKSNEAGTFNEFGKKAVY